MKDPPCVLRVLSLKSFNLNFVAGRQGQMAKSNAFHWSSRKQIKISFYHFKLPDGYGSVVFKN